MAQIQTPSNPYVAGSPVSRPEMFFGRSDVFEFVRNALVGQHQDNVIVLYGKRRTGKTSVLYQMHRNIEPKYLPILIDLQALTMDSVNGFFFEIASTVQRGLRREFNIEVPRPDRADFESDPLEGFEETFMGQVTEAIGDRHLLLMIDEAARLDEQVQAQKLPPDVFGHLRSLMQHNASLNFIFSVGERLERMKSQYALLFTVALYKEISFLDRKSAESLISEPAQPLYSYEDSAVDRISEITSGHAYFMQLLCHSIFAQWQREGMPKVIVDHVNRVATEVVERGSANLKFDWDDTSSVDKLVLSAMAEALDEQTTSVTLKDVQQILEGYDILVPRGDLISAQRSLIGKELVSDAADSRYTIDFLRLWVRQHQKLQWVKEELSTEIGGLREIAEAEIAASEKQATRRKFRWGALVFSAAIVVAVVVPLISFAGGGGEVTIMDTVDFTQENKCGFLGQPAGGGMLTCVRTVDKLSDNTLRFNVEWTADIGGLTAGGDLTPAVGREKSEVGAVAPYLEDSNGVQYHYIDVGGSAAASLALTHGQTDAGSFLFPPLETGITSVSFVDLEPDTGAQFMIEGIVLE